MARHMLRKLEDLSVSELADLFAEVSAEHQRRASDIRGVGWLGWLGGELSGATFILQRTVGRGIVTVHVKK